jgi:hypothetical protein
MASSRVVSAVQTIPGAKTHGFKAGGSVAPPASTEGASKMESGPPPAESPPAPRSDYAPAHPEMDLSTPVIPPAPSMPRPASMIPQRTPEEAALLPTEPDAICAELLDELEGPLLDTVREAVQRLGSPERIRLWVDGQARRRLIGLTERFTTELRTAPSSHHRTSRPPPADLPAELAGERASQPPPPPSRRK